MLSELVAKDYDAMIADLKSNYRNINPFLLVKSMMLSRKYPKEDKQMFWLDIYFKPGVDDQRKNNEIFAKLGRLLVHQGHNHFKIDLQTNLETIISLSNDKDIERLEGEVFPLSS